MTSKLQIRIAGYGGQGIVFMGTILGKAAVEDGYYASGSTAYGSQARGGVTRAEIVISQEPILFPHVIKSDLLIALTSEAHELFARDLAEGGRLIYDREQPHTRSENPNYDLIEIDATKRSIDEFNSPQNANLVALGAANIITNIVNHESIIAALESSCTEKHLKSNIRALEVGKELGLEKL